MSKRPPPPKRRPTVGQSQAPSHLLNQGPLNVPPSEVLQAAQEPHLISPSQGPPQNYAPQAPPQTDPPRAPPIAIPPNRNTSPSRMSRQLPPPPTSTPRRNASPLGQGRRPQAPISRADGSASPTRRHPDQEQSAPVDHTTPDRGSSRPPPPKRRPSMAGAAPSVTSPQRVRSGSLLPDSRPPVSGDGERTRSTSRPPPPKSQPSMTGTAPTVVAAVPVAEERDRVKGVDEKPKTVRAISEATGVSIVGLREANPDLNGVGNDEMIPKGTKLRIPTAPRSLPTRRDVPQSPPPQGVSAGGETLAVVAHRAGVPLTAIQSLNPHLAHVDPYMDVLPVGTTLHVPATDAVLESTPAVEDVVVGTPRSEMSQTTPANESILDVARSTNTSVQDILRLNPFLQDYPLDKPLPPKTRIQLPEEDDESSPLSQATSPSASPAPTLSAGSVSNLRDIALFYGVHLHDVTGLNIQAAAVFGVDRDVPIGTKINVPATAGYPGGVVHVVGEGPIEVSRRAISPQASAPAAPQTLNDVSRIVGHPVEAIRGLGDLDDHVEVGVSCPPRCNDRGMGEPENLWTVSPDNELPSVVINKLLDAAKTEIGKRRESLDSLSLTTKVDVEHIRRANDELPDGYPSAKPVPRGMRIFIPKPPVTSSSAANPPVASPPMVSPPVVDPEVATQSPITPPIQVSAGGVFDRYVATGYETLADIASRHRADVDLLIRMNGALVDDPDEAYTDPLPQGVTVRIPRGSQQSPAPEVVSPLIPARSLSEPTADPDPVPETSVPVVASPFLRRQQLQSQSAVKDDEPMEEPRPPVQATRPISPPKSESSSPSRHSVSPNRGRRLESDPTPSKFIPEYTSAVDTNDDDSRRSIPTKTILASGNESLRNVCDTHFLTEPQLRSMNPFLERYHSGTLIPKNTLIVLETAGFAEDKVTATHNKSAAKPQVEEVDGRHVFVVKSPTRDRPRAISSHRAMSSPEEPSASGATPTNTLRAISEAVGIPEQILRRRNPHLGLIGSNDELPKGTIVELEGSAMGPVGGMTASPRAVPTNNTTISLTKRNLNRRQVVRVMGHKTAIQVGQRYFSKWRLFVSLFNSKKMNREITIENEMEKLRVQVQTGKITESDLRRRVTELRMALDSSRPYSDELRGGTVQSPVRRVSPMRGMMRNESIAAVAAHSVDDNYYRHAAAGLNTTESPTRLASTPRRLQPVMMAGAPAVTENRAPFDRSREVGGVGASVRVNSPLRDQPTLHDASTPRRNPSPYRQLMEATAQSVTSPALSNKSVDRRNQRRSLGMLLNGLRVVRVSGAASAAGIQSNDLVLRVDGSLVSSGTTFKSLVDRAKGPKVSVTLQTPTGHIFTVMLPLFSEDGRSSPSRGPELSRLADPPSMRQASPRSAILSSPYRRPISASRR